MTVTCIQIGLYGVFTLGWPNCLQLALCNGLGALFWLVNLSVFVCFARSPRERAALAGGYALALAWALGLPLGLYLGSGLPASTQQTTLAVFMQAANFSGFLSPVASLRAAWRSGDVSRVPGLLSWVNLLNSGVWTAYGILLPDPWIWAPNVVGIVLSGAQVVVLLLLRARSIGESQKRLAGAAAAAAAPPLQLPAPAPLPALPSPLPQPAPPPMPMPAPCPSSPRAGLAPRAQTPFPPRQTSPLAPSTCATTEQPSSPTPRPSRPALRQSRTWTWAPMCALGTTPPCRPAPSLPATLTCA
jgi:hypothetical protein